MSKSYLIDLDGVIVRGSELIPGADAFLVRDAAGFDMPVGERGGRLSGGQRQFLAVSRALVEPGALLYLETMPE